MRKYLTIFSLFILLFPLGLLASDIVSSSGQRYLFAYFEYFQFCDDIGAEPLPVLAAGVCCQNSRGGGQPVQVRTARLVVYRYQDEV